MALNLCNNKLHQLDGLSDMIEKTPQVKILKLSKNKVRRGARCGLGCAWVVVYIRIMVKVR